MPSKRDLARVTQEFHCLTLAIHSVHAVVHRLQHQLELAVVLTDTLLHILALGVVYVFMPIY